MNEHINQNNCHTAEVAIKREYDLKAVGYTYGKQRRHPAAAAAYADHESFLFRFVDGFLDLFLRNSEMLCRLLMVSLYRF